MIGNETETVIAAETMTATTIETAAEEAAATETVTATGAAGAIADTRATKTATGSVAEVATVIEATAMTRIAIALEREVDLGVATTTMRHPRTPSADQRTGMQHSTICATILCAGSDRYALLFSAAGVMTTMMIAAVALADVEDSLVA